MDRKLRRSTTASALWLLVVIAVNRLFGMVRTFLLARLFGVSNQAAAFELAQSLTSSLYDCTLGALLATMFLPSYLEKATTHDQEKADRFAATLSLFAALGVFLLFLPYILFPLQTVLLLAGNLSSETQLAAAKALPSLSLAKMLLAVASLFTGILQADQKPILPAVVYATASCVSLPFVYLFRDALTAAKLSYLLLLIDLGVFFLLFSLVRKQHHPRSLTNILPPQPFHTLRCASAVLLFSAYLPLLTCLTSLFLANIGKDSAVAVSGYALKPILLASALLFSTFHAVYYPQLSKKRKQIRVLLLKPLVLFILLSLLAAAFFFLFAEKILVFFLSDALISTESMLSALRIMRLYAASLPFLALVTIGNDIAYLLKRSKQVAALSLFSILLDVLLFVFLKGSFGVDSVPIAFVVSLAVRALLTWHILIRAMRPTAKIKLLLVLTDCNVGGAGRQLINYLSHCDQSRFDVTVALPKHSHLTERVNQLGFHVRSCGKESSLSLSSVFSYYRLIKKEKPHILHANASLSARIAAFLAGVPIRLYTRHCVYPTPKLFQKSISRLTVRLATNLLSTSVVAVAEEAANNLYDMGVSRNKVKVILNGVDPIPQNTEQRNTLRKQYGITSSETLAVICGRIEPDKGIRTLIEAIALLAREEQPIKALIVGTGSEEVVLQSLTKSLALSDQVYFCGFVNNVSPYLNAADVYVNCSVGTEATSLAIAEAMSVHLPIVATSYGGNTAMVKDGKNGILVPQNDPRALADALLIMTDDKLRQRFGNTSYEIYASAFSAKMMAQSNEALYQNLFIEKGYSLP